MLLMRNLTFDVWALNPFDWRTYVWSGTTPSKDGITAASAIAAHIHLSLTAIAAGRQTMNMLVSNLFETSSHYFERQAEKLVLEGYRHWTAGFETGSVIPWEMAWTIYTQELGLTNAKRAITELSHFIRTLHFNAACQLKAFPYGSMHICREECLLMGLISAMQNGDDTTRDACLDALITGSRVEQVKQAAQDYAQTMAELDQVLLPIPHYAVASILLPQSSSAGRHIFH